MEHFQNLDRVLSHKAGLTKVRRTRMPQSMLPNHNGIKIEVTDQRLTTPIPNQAEGGTQGWANTSEAKAKIFVSPIARSDGVEAWTQGPLKSCCPQRC